MSEVSAAVLEAVRAVAPHLRQQTKWGMPWWTGRDLVLLSGEFSHHVGVEFWRGSTLADPRHLLEGTGKNLRHVKLRTVAEARSPAFVALVRAAVRLDAISEPRKR